MPDVGSKAGPPHSAPPSKPGKIIVPSLTWSRIFEYHKEKTNFRVGEKNQDYLNLFPLKIDGQKV